MVHKMGKVENINIYMESHKKFTATFKYNIFV